ncbi:trypsin-like peptidase domain-containing protein [Actinoalloteichus caeruleus]|uniref:VMAP-C domain-containing protein n=1 Tax=Actinoalloteichus cyanogriseus TaxID=2893586 RepID=UPI003BB99C72
MFHGGSKTGELSRKLADCVVLVEGDDIEGGTGFFVAPGYVLTCSHVVGWRRGPVTVTWPAGSLHGTVVFADPEAPDHLTSAGLTQYPDLAVIEIEDTTSVPGCVFLGDRVFLGEQRPGLEGSAHVEGYATIYSDEPHLSSARLTYSGFTDLQNQPLLRVSGDEIPSGMSGSPLLDMRTGEVLGLVRTNRNANQPHGGLALPVAALRRLPGDLLRSIWRAHDLFHADEGPWTSLRTQLLTQQRQDVSPPPLINPADEAALLGILARLDRVEDVNAVFHHAAYPQVPSLNIELLDYHDTVQVLANLPLGGQLHPVLRFLAALLDRCHDPVLQVLLRENLRRLAVMFDQKAVLDEHLGSESGPSPNLRRTSSVLAEVVPSAHDPDQYLFTLWLYRGPGQWDTQFRETTPRPEPGLWQRIQDELPKALRRLGERHAIVEFVLPLELLNEPIDRWQLWPEQTATRLGQRHAVVLRSLDNWQDEEETRREDSAARWEYLRDLTGPVPLTLVRCRDDREREAWAGLFQLPAGQTALALANPPTEPSTGEVIVEGLFAGVPVLLWRRDLCDLHYSDSPGSGTGESCAGTRFLDTLDRSLQGVGVTDLPWKVRDLRNMATQPGADDDHPGHQVVLLWEDPERRPPDEYPLASPS